MANTAPHVGNYVNHTSARVQKDADIGINPVLFFKNLNLLRLIVVVESKIFLGQIRNEISSVVFHSRKDIDQVDINFEILRGRGKTQSYKSKHAHETLKRSEERRV